MFTFLIVLIALIGLLLTLIVLLQSGKGGGLAGIASGGATQQILGARTAPDVLEKATWALGGVFIVLCIVTNFFIGGPAAEDQIFDQSDIPSTTQQPLTPPSQSAVPPANSSTDPAPAGDDQ
ncbi:MAG: preprotein translocase subunit SecG [Rhodothermales bacterium]|nr:preprotein translocase subunit SecG [Rhodothermales bacterium]